MENENITVDFPRGQLNTIILATMENGDKYGYDIVDDVKTKTGIEIKQPTLYSSLKRMEAQKYISSYWKDSTIGGKRHYYSLTGEGRKFLSQNSVDYSIFKPNFENVSVVKTPIVEKTAIQEKPVDNSEFVQYTLFNEPEKVERPVEKRAEERIEENTENIKEEIPATINPKEVFEEEKNDAVFITERIEPEDMPKFQRIEPSTLNIETCGNTDFLNTKLRERQLIKEDTLAKEAYKQKISEMFAKKNEMETITDKQKASNKNLQTKIDNFESKKSGDFQQNTQTNTYERVGSDLPVFNSYQSLKTYYDRKGIDFSIYEKKEKRASEYVNSSLINLVRGSLFLIYSIILSFAFYFGIKATTVGSEIYAVLPSFFLLLVCLYAYNYYKDQKKTIITEQKGGFSPIILGVLGVCLVLVIIAINLIAGFNSSNALYYFPLLIYPICLACHIILIVPLNSVINKLIIKYRRWRNK